MNIAHLKERSNAFAQTRHGRRIVTLARSAFAVSILAYLVYNLSRIGWSDLWASRPKSILYFALLPVLYLMLPVAEGFIYRKLWGIRIRDGMLASLRKRTLNTDVLNYSGEVQFYLWARNSVALTPGTVLKNIKDNLLLSSAAGIISAILLLAAFVATGLIETGAFSGGVQVWHIGVAALAVIPLAVAAARFRSTIFSLPGRTLAFMLGVHISRFVGGWALLILQWWSVLPEVPFHAWALLLTSIVLVDRIPFIPSKDLMQASVGIGLASMLDVSAATVAGLFLVRSVFDKTLNLSIYTGSTLRKRNTTAPVEEEEPVAVPAVTGEAQLARAA